MILLVMAVLALWILQVGATSDMKGSKDPTLFTRMPGWYISQYDENEFGAYEFTGANGQKTTVEGHKLIISYAWAGAGKKPSSLQVVRNYQNAIKKIGGTVLYERGDDFTTMQLLKDGRETWAELTSEVDAGWGGYILTIIEKGGMTQEVKADAAAMKASIKTEGHIAVYGIHFDTNKAEIKPESDAAIAEIAKLLKQDSTLKLHVVGHTDNVGTIDAKMKLSNARAGAVKAVLVNKHGIAAGRLSSFGAGPYCPVATNLTEEGRAKNRRVELVQQ
jgi:outer membrane protein OmpA-like peptidoglycan-associated protein